MKAEQGTGNREQGTDRNSRRHENTALRCSLHRYAAIRRAIFFCSLFPVPCSLLFGCARPPKPGLSDVPPGVRKVTGVYVDVNPRWSHDGKRIAFLRSTTDRKMQLQVTNGSLKQVQALFAPELLCPDRPYSPQLQRYSSPDTLAWSPDDRLIAFERTDWFLFEDGERLPGTGLWSFDTQTRAVQPLALHAPTYKNLFYFYHTPQWSPDSRYLAFVGEGINGQRVVFTRSLALQNPKAVTPRFDTYADSDWPVWQEGEEEKETEEGTGNREQGTEEEKTKDAQSAIGNRQSAMDSSFITSSLITFLPSRYCSRAGGSADGNFAVFVAGFGAARFGAGSVADAGGGIGRAVAELGQRTGDCAAHGASGLVAGRHTPCVHAYPGRQRLCCLRLMDYQRGWNRGASGQPAGRTRLCGSRMDRQ